MVCSTCGTQHAIEYALESRGEPFITHYDALVVAMPAERRIETMAVVRNALKVGLGEAKRLVDNLPLRIAADVVDWIGRQRAEPFENAGASVELVPSSRVPNAAFGPVQADRLLAATGPVFCTGEIHIETPVVVAIRGPTTGPAARFALVAQACGSCGEVGALIDSNEPPLPMCPACGGSAPLVVGGWVT